MPRQTGTPRETPKAIRDAFGQRVRELREAIPDPRHPDKHISQENFALEAGVHRTWVSAIERGERAPSLGSICVLAKALGVTPSELLQGIEAS